MYALKFGLRAYRDYYDRVWSMLGYSVLWLALNATIVFGPAASLLLFRVADPRQGVWEERITLRESARFLRVNWIRSWKLWLATVPMIALFAFNLDYYGSSDHWLAILTPVWLILMIVATIFTIVTFACAATMDLAALEALRTGARLTLIRFPHLLMILLVTALVPYTLITSLLSVLIPLMIIVPGTVSIALSRYVLIARKIAVPDPREPTEERLIEKRTE